MFKELTDQKKEFSFNRKIFEIYNEDLIPDLLGASGNQTAINGGGSTWKKIIKRNENPKQKASEKYNPKYYELFNLIKNHIEIPENFPEVYNKDELIQNLIEFKEDPSFRKEVFNDIFLMPDRFKENVPLKYSYILLTIYIGLNYTYFERNEKEKFNPIEFKDKKEYIEKYNEIIMSDVKISNLTCFCYTQYFWFDYHLSDSSESKIHEILFEIYESMSKLKISPSKKEEVTKENQIYFDAKETKVGDLLGAMNQFFVPNYQREFSWLKNEQIKTFINDVFNIYENGQKVSKYFLGSIVLIEREDGNFEIIDGQQRLTTILITLSALKELYSTDELKKGIQEPYLTYRVNVGEERKEFHKLSLNKNNKDFFRKYLTSDRAEEARAELRNIDEGSNKLIFSAFNIIKEEINKRYSSGLEDISKDAYISNILELIKGKITLVKIVVNNKKTSNTIFETLNDRGKTLEDHENIKNHVYGRAFKNPEEIESSWDSLVDSYGSKKFSRYLSNVYRSKYEGVYKKLSKSSFFTHFKANEEISKDYYKFVLELESELAIYDSLVNPKGEDWDSKTYDKLKILEAFNVEGIYLVLLSSKIKDFHFKKILNWAIKLVFKNKFSKQLPYNLNEVCAKISKKIRDGDITINTIEEEFDKIIKASDDKIKINFLEEEIYGRGNFAKRILILLNSFSSSKKIPIGWDSMTVEHIYAQSSPDTFKAKIKKIEEDYCAKYKKKFSYNQNTIYNLTLLPSLLNKKAGDKDFPDKKEIYSETRDHVRTNKKLSSFDDWNLESWESYKEYIWRLTQEIFCLK